MRAQVVDHVRNHRTVAGAIEFRSIDGEVCGIAFVCPCGCGQDSWLPVNGHGRPGPSWEWDGNREAPTLNPSVFNSGMPCQWHGWLRAGMWVSC